VVENIGYQSIDLPDDVLGHGWITARFRITRVLRGAPPARLVTIRYFAHAALVKNSRMKIRLRPDADGSFTVCAAPGENGLRCRD
jgi:integration host factor subunit beta